jgi:hypothetical protein
MALSRPIGLLHPASQGYPHPLDLRWFHFSELSRTNLLQGHLGGGALRKDVLRPRGVCCDATTRQAPLKRLYISIVCRAKGSGADESTPEVQNEGTDNSLLEDSSVLDETQAAEAENTVLGAHPSPVEEEMHSSCSVRSSTEQGDLSGGNGSVSVISSVSVTSSFPPEIFETNVGDLNEVSPVLRGSISLSLPDAVIAEPEGEVLDVESNNQEQLVSEAVDEKGLLAVKGPWLWPWLRLPAFKFRVLFERLKFWGRKGSYVPVEFKVCCCTSDILCWIVLNFADDKLRNQRNCCFLKPKVALM